MQQAEPAHADPNPVIFVVEVVSVMLTIEAIGRVFGGESYGYALHIAAWLWFTVLFANFAEAMAEGRGKAQAESLRKTRSEAIGTRLLPDGTTESVPASELRKGDVVLVSAGEVIPTDGTVIEGIASVDESAITGESAPVIREAGGDRSSVTGGTKVLSDWIKVEVVSEPGRDVPRQDDRPRRARQEAEDPERDRALDPPDDIHDHLPHRDPVAATVRDLRRAASRSRRL